MGRRRSARWLPILLLVIAGRAQAQVVTVDFATGLAAPTAIVIDAADNMYVADFGTGSITAFPASGGAVAGGTGIAGFATGLNGPLGMALDSANNLYVANRNGNSITEFPASGGVVTGGTGVVFAAGLDQPVGLLIDRDNNLYVANASIAPGAGTITKFAAVGGAVSTGAPTTGFATGLDFPGGMALDGANNLYVTNNGGTTIRKFPSAGGAVTGGTGIVFATGLNGPAGLAVDGSGALYASIEGDGTLLRFPAAGGIPSANGAVFAAGLGADVFLIATDAGFRNLYVPDSGGSSVARVGQPGPPAPALGPGALAGFALLLGLAGLRLRRR
jgi:DNA-binding beta-propeller fold protein YncE